VPIGVRGDEPVDQMAIAACILNQPTCFERLFRPGLAAIDQDYLRAGQQSHRTGQANPECFRRKLQRPAARRASERDALSLAATRPCRVGGLATERQRRVAPFESRLADSSGLCSKPADIEHATGASVPALAPVASTIQPARSVDVSRQFDDPVSAHVKQHPGDLLAELLGTHDARGKLLLEHEAAVRGKNDAVQAAWFSRSIRSFAASPDEEGFWPVISRPSLTT
jgi:hypothetical protein